MSVHHPSQFAALVGIDWADAKHDICELDQVRQTISSTLIKHSPETIDQWARALKQRYGGKVVAVATELKSGPLINALRKYSHLTLFTVNPSTVAKYRKAFTQSGAKNDIEDARIILDILRRHMDKLSPLSEESTTMKNLAMLVEARRSLVQNRVDLSNRITGLLKNYYPQVIDWFKEKDSVIFCDFIARWPSLSEAKRARKTTLQAFFNEHNARYTLVNKSRIAEIKAAEPLTCDPGVIDPNRLIVTLLVPQLKLLLESIDRVDKEIAQRYRQQKDAAIFSSFPGAGPCLAPRLCVAFGEDRSRYQSASDLQKYAGVAPVIEQSGQKRWVHWRYSCPKFLRQTFVEWAGQTVRFSFWAKAFYEQQKAKGKSHNTIIRALAFKWIRIAFRCWKDRRPYDESVYLSALKERKSPLLKYAISA